MTQLARDKPINLSTWHVVDKKGKTEHVVKDVLIAGGKKYLRVISESPHYLKRVYEEVYGKKYHSKYKERTLRVKRIVIHEKPDLGFGVGCLDEDVMKKYGF